MGTSAVKLSSAALVLLGDEPISSFTDGTSGATIASTLYETSYLAFLTTHRWRFAVKKHKFARLTAKPLNEFKYQYQLPSDCIYLVRVDTNHFQQFEDKIYCDHATLEGDYMYRVDESQLPSYFIKALEFYLATQFAVPLTGDMNKGNFYANLYLNESKKAKFADSTQHPAPAAEAGSAYVRVRY